MIAHATSGTVNSNDFWATRNALLHEQTSNSTLTRRAEATPFLYVDRDGLGAFSLTAEWRVPPLIMKADAIVDAFEKATVRFRSFIDTSTRRDRILTRCLEWFDYGAELRFQEAPR